MNSKISWTQQTKTRRTKPETKNQNFTRNTEREKQGEGVHEG